MKLSPQQEDALKRARDAGGLRYVRGGYWVEAGTDPEAFLAFAWDDQKRPWHALSVTVKALVKKGLLVWTDTSPGYPVRAELAPNPEH